MPSFWAVGQGLRSQVNLRHLVESSMSARVQAFLPSCLRNGFPWPSWMPWNSSRKPQLRRLTTLQTARFPSAFAFMLEPHKGGVSRLIWWCATLPFFMGTPRASTGSATSQGTTTPCRCIRCSPSCAPACQKEGSSRWCSLRTGRANSAKRQPLTGFTFMPKSACGQPRNTRLFGACGLGAISHANGFLVNSGSWNPLKVEEHGRPTWWPG